MRESGLLLTADYSRWYSYALEDRHAPWKVLLPVSFEASILAIGLSKNYLASLARSYKTVHVYKCRWDDIKWAEDDGRALGFPYRFVDMKEIRPESMDYLAVVVSSDFTSTCDPQLVFKLLEPGGIALWVGPRNHVPSNRELLINGYEKINRYTLLPPRTGKIMLPLQNRKSFRSSLDFFKPFKWHNRFALRSVKLLNIHSMESLLRFRQAVSGRKGEGSTNGISLLEWLGERLGCYIYDSAIYMGYTKLVLQLLGKTGNIIGIAKVADMVLGKRSIERETFTLRRLSEIKKLSDSIPAILSMDQIEGYTIQVQTVPGSGTKKYTNRLTPSHISFLKKLSQVDRCEMFLKDWPSWPQLCRWAVESAFGSQIEAESLRSALKRIADKFAEIKIPFHRIHGDFAPRHALLTAQGIIVIDWEDSEPLGLPLYDAVHFFMKQLIDQEHKSINIRDLLNWPKSNSVIVDICNTFEGSVPLVKDIARLAIICAYRILMCPKLRCAEWV